MNKNIKSDEYIWNEITSSWKEASRALEYYKSATNELEKASELIRRHSDVKNLHLGSMGSRIKKLDRDAEEFIHFTRKIHSEFVSEVDRPFYKNIMECVSDVYRINPSEFTLNKTRPNKAVERIVLTDLLAATILDVELRESFNERVTELDEDAPSDTIKGLIVHSISEYYGSDYDAFMTSPDLSKVKEYNASREIYIDYYEMLNPEKAKKIDRLLVDMSADTSGRYAEDVDNLKFITYMAQEPYQSLFFEYLDGMEIAEHNYTYIDKNGVERTTQFWSPTSNTLTLNFDPNYDYGLVDPRGPYTVFFHEVGHGVDDVSRPEAKKFLWFNIGKDKKIVEEYRNENNQTLNDVMIEDVKEYLSMEIEAVASSKGVTLTKEQSEAILDNMMAVDSQVYIKGLNGKINHDLTDIYKDVCANMETLFHGAKIGGISDAYGGITNNRIRGQYGHGEYGKKNDYWFRKDGSVRTYASTELYAHNFAYQMTGSVEQQEYIATYFPRADQFMKQMADDLYHEIEGEGR